MGFLTRLFIPRSVRRAVHPGRAVKRAVTPKVVKRARRAMSPIDNLQYSVERSVATSLRSGGKRKRSSSPVYQHEGCTVRHRTAQAAQQCAAKTMRQFAPPAPRWPVAPPQLWYPRPGWGTVRNYQTRPAGNGLIDLEAHFVPDDGSQPQYIALQGVAPESSMGEYARGTFDGETLEIKVGTDVMHELGADTSHKVNALPLEQRQALIADLGSLGADAGWTVTPEWQLVPAAPGLF